MTRMGPVVGLTRLIKNKLWRPNTGRFLSILFLGCLYLTFLGLAASSLIGIVTLPFLSGVQDIATSLTLLLFLVAIFGMFTYKTEKALWRRISLLLRDVRCESIKSPTIDWLLKTHTRWKERNSENGPEGSPEVSSPTVSPLKELTPGTYGLGAGSWSPALLQPPTLKFDLSHLPAAPPSWIPVPGFTSMSVGGMSPKFEILYKGEPLCVEDLLLGLITGEVPLTIMEQIGSVYRCFAVFNGKRIDVTFDGDVCALVHPVSRDLSEMQMNAIFSHKGVFDRTQQWKADNAKT